MSVVDIEVAKAELNITEAAQVTKLQRALDGAEDAIARKCGPLEPTTVTERVSGGGSGLVLRCTPVIELTSVTTASGATYSLDTLEVDKSAGVIEFLNGQRFPTGRYTVVFEAGRETLPDDLRDGIIELLRHRWDVQRGPTGRPGSNPSETYANTIPGAAHAFPFRVTELISPHVQVGN